MKLIGITGPVGSGKSMVAAMLKEKGALVLDADKIARDVVAPDKPAWKKILDRFGETVLGQDGEIDRLKLGDIVFGNPENLAYLNSIIHPQVISEIDRKLKEIEVEFGNGRIVVLDVPLLIEVGLHERCDLTVVVTADRDIRLDRMLQKGFSREQAEIRIAAQAGKEDLEKQADIIITNNETPNALKEKVEGLWKTIEEKNIRGKN